MGQSDGYAAPGKETWVCRLQKGLYSLVQAGRTRNQDLNTRMKGIRYAVTEKVPAVYVRSTWNQADFAAGGFLGRRFHWYWLWEGS